MTALFLGHGEEGRCLELGHAAPELGTRLAVRWPAMLLLVLGRVAPDVAVAARPQVVQMERVHVLTRDLDLHEAGRRRREETREVKRRESKREKKSEEKRRREGKKREERREEST